MDSASLWQNKEQHRVAEVIHRLAQAYPEANCALHHKNPYQLLVATILSAQCTDTRVNLVTPHLFKRHPSPQSMAQADETELQELIHSTGFFRSKTKYLIGASQTLVNNFGGKTPCMMDDLLKLPGVARKTANVVLGTAFGLPAGIVVDTHVSRLSRRLGLSQEKDPNKIEQNLIDQIPQSEWIDFSHRLIHHGRQVCLARKPRCHQCTLADLCPYYQELAKSQEH